eukprot:gene2875-biopygen4488
MCNGVAHLGLGQESLATGGKPLSPNAGRGASSLTLAAFKRMIASSEPGNVHNLLSGAEHALGIRGYTALISDCGKRNDTARAHAVFQAVPHKNVWHYSAIIAALGQAGEWQPALGVLEELKRLHRVSANPSLKPNIVTYSSAIAAVAKGQRLDFAIRLYNEMIAAGLQPDAVTHYILLSTCIRLQSWPHVEWLLEDMHSKGVAARTPIYTGYMRELCSQGNWNKAVGLFCAMQDVGQAPTAGIVMELLQCLVCKHRPLMAACLLAEAEAEGLLDNVRSVRLQDLVLEALVAAGHHLQAWQLHKHLVSRGWPAKPAGQPNGLWEQCNYSQQHQELADCKQQQQQQQQRWLEQQEPLLPVPDQQTTAEDARQSQQEQQQQQQQPVTNHCLSLPGSKPAGGSHHDVCAISSAVNAVDVTAAKSTAELSDLQDEAAHVSMFDLGSTTAEDSASVHSEAASTASSAMTATTTTSSMAGSLLIGTVCCSAIGSYGVSFDVNTLQDLAAPTSRGDQGAALLPVTQTAAAAAAATAELDDHVAANAAVGAAPGWSAANLAAPRTGQVQVQLCT